MFKHPWSIAPVEGTQSRRSFVRTVAGTMALVAAPARPGMTSEATLVARFAASLSADQRAAMHFPVSHPNRSRIGNHWAVSPVRVGDLSGVQQELCRQILDGLLTDSGRARVARVLADDVGGLVDCAVAVFGEAGTALPFEWVISGRHLTLRADGHRRVGASFDGPLFLGHTGDALRELQDQARALLTALDPGTAPRPEAAASWELRALEGAPRALSLGLLEGLLSPFRSETAPLDPGSLRFTAFPMVGQPTEAGSIWKVEGPGFSASFHGWPHAHLTMSFEHA